MSRKIILYFQAAITGAICMTAIAGSSVAYNAGAGQRNVVDPAGIPLADGNEVRVGCFSEGFDPAQHAGDLAALQAAWIELDRSAIRTLFNHPGGFASVASRAKAALDGRRLCFWIFETYGNGLVAGDFGNVAAYGLFSSTAVNWLSPAASAPPPADTALISSSEVDTAWHGSFETESLKLQALARPYLTYNAWAAAQFGSQGAASMSSPNADPDHDGMSNLLEYALGANPRVADASPATLKRESIGGVDSLSWTFPRLKDRPDAFVTVQSSTDLVHWSSDAVTETILSDSLSLQIVRDSVAIQDHHRFLKLSVEPIGATAGR